MRWPSLLFLAAAPLWAAPVTVTGTVRLTDGTLANGAAYINLTGTCIGEGGAVVMTPTKIVPFTAGVFTVALEPSSTCVPSQVSRVEWRVAGWTAPRVEFWNVTGPGPTTIGSVRVPGIPVSSGALGLSYLTGLSCKGDLIAYSGTATVRVPCGSAGKVLKYDAAAAAGVSWQDSAAAYGRYSATLASSSTWTITGATHALGTCALAWQLWVSNLAVEPDTVSCNASTFDVTITFSSAQAGDVYLTSDPAFVADNLLNGSLVSQIASQTIIGSLITITHNFAAVVILRCYDSSGNRLYYDSGTRLSANALTVSFIGAASGFCVAGR